MPGDAFVDPNIWVYAHLEDPAEPRGKPAWQLIKRLLRPVVSAQVIAEYFSVMRRNGREGAWAQRNVERMLQHCRIQAFTAGRHDPAERVRESIWSSALARLADSIFYFSQPLGTQEPLGREMGDDRQRRPTARCRARAQRRTHGRGPAQPE